jgi:hypothetical protein
MNQGGKTKIAVTRATGQMGRLVLQPMWMVQPGVS